MKIGSYTADTRLFHSPKATIYYASKSNLRSKSGNKFILKLVQPNIEILGAEVAAQVKDNFLDAARVQETISRVSPHWAPIYESGSYGSWGGYYVTNYYKNTAQRLIDTKTEMTQSILYAIVNSIVKGLSQLKNKEGRAHGNLIPTNILVKVRGRSLKDVSSVVLTDPLPSKMVDKLNGESADLESIGELIYQLIFHESFRADIQKESSKWSVLGTKKDQWLDLCYDLLHTKSYTLEKFTTQLSSLRPKSKLHLWVASLALVFIAFLVGRILIPTPEQPPPFNRHAWHALCQEHSWFFSFNEQLREDWSNNRIKLWQQDPQLKKILNALKNVWENGINITPNQIAGTGGSFDYLARHPPESAKTEQAMRETKGALQIISLIVDTLDLEAIHGEDRKWIKVASDAFVRYPKWETLVSFEDFRDRVENRGWIELAHYIDELVLTVRKPSNSVHEGVNTIMDLRDPLHEVMNQLEALTRLLIPLSGSTDKVLAEVNRYINQELKEVSTFSELTDWLQVITGEDSPISKLVAFIDSKWHHINHKRFFEESIVHRDFTGDVSKSTYLSWLNEAMEYEVKPDPRIEAIKKFKETLRHIEDDILWLEARKSPRVSEFREKVDYLKTTIETRPNQDSVVVKDQTEIEVWERKLAEAVDDLRQKVQQEKPAYEAKPAVWLDEIRTLSFDVSNIIDSEWKVRRDYLLQDVTIDDLRDDFNKFLEFKDKAERITDLFTFIDQSLPKTLGEFSHADIAPRDWHQSFEWICMQERETVLKKSLLLVEWAEGIPNVSVKEFEANGAWVALRQGFVARCDDLTKLRLDCHTVESRLNEGYMLEEPFGIEGNRVTLAELHSQITNSRFYEIKEIKQALAQPIFSRISTLRAIENKKKAGLSQGDKWQLTEIALDEESPVVIALAAWRALDSLGLSNLVQDKNLITEMYENLDVMVMGIDDVTRKNLLHKFLNGQFLLYQYQIRVETLQEAVNKIEALYSGSSHELELERFSNQLSSYSEKMSKRYPSQISEDQLSQSFHGLNEVIDGLKQLAVGINNSAEIVVKLNSTLSGITSAKQGIEDYLNALGMIDKARMVGIAKNLEDLVSRVEQEKIERFSRNPRKGDITVFEQLHAEFTTIERELDLWRIIEDLRDQEVQTDIDFLNSEWQHWCSVKLDSLTSETVNNNKSMYYNEVRNIYNLKTFLEILAKNPELKKDLKDKIKNMRLPNENEFVTRIQEYKRALLSETIRKFFFNEAELVPDDVVDRFVSFRDRASSMIVDFNKIEKNLNAGYTLNEGISGSSISDLYGKWKNQQDVFPLLKDAFQGVVNRISALIAVVDIPGRALVAKIDEAPEVLMTAWSKLREDKNWPRDMAELKQEMEVRRSVEKLIQDTNFRDANPEQTKRYMEALTSGGPKVWLEFIERSKSREEVDFAIANRSQFKVVDSELPDWALYNVLLYQFKNKNIKDADNKTILELRDQLVSSLKALSGLANTPAIIEFQTKLNDLKTQSNEANIRDLGPGASGWDADIRQYPDKVVYSKTLNDKKRSLVFYLVDSTTDPTSEGAYVSASEVSLGFMADFIASHNLLENEDFVELFPPYSPYDDWRGPRVWERKRNGKKMTPGSQWLWRSPQMGGINFYPNELKVTRPHRGHPMQYISPVAALYVAKKLGCRFPTSKEWITARRDSGKQTLINLRGEKFEKQKNYILGLGASEPPLPDEGIFRPTTMKTTGNKSVVAPKASKHSDPALWFVPVTSESKDRFFHLIGNVAEYTLDFHNKAEREGDILVDDIRNILFSAKEKLGVIGGSALSPPELEIDTPYFIDLDEAEYGYSDVGFRLAFTALPPTLATRWKLLLAGQKVLPALKIK